MCTFTVAPIPYAVTVWSRLLLFISILLLVEIFYDCQQAGHRHKLTAKKLNQNVSRGFYVTIPKTLTSAPCLPFSIFPCCRSI